MSLKNSLERTDFLLPFGSPAHGCKPPSMLHKHIVDLFRNIETILYDASNVVPDTTSLVSDLRERDTRGGNLHGTDDAKLIALK
ncbi:hypothetical protein MRS44_002237 [Fusarium solani]|uniref:uncharacterized protein n=1 Tax=Fusarium solani TaxID=169388 RepID=UPI0032C4827F|nr:hypothetical protein MRS44_002237 [Fusarium solani]